MHEQQSWPRDEAVNAPGAVSPGPSGNGWASTSKWRSVAPRCRADACAGGRAGSHARLHGAASRAGSRRAVTSTRAPPCRLLLSVPVQHDVAEPQAAMSAAQQGEFRHHVQRAVIDGESAPARRDASARETPISVASRSTAALAASIISKRGQAPGRASRGNRRPPPSVQPQLRQQRAPRAARKRHPSASAQPAQRASFDPALRLMDLPSPSVANTTPQGCLPFLASDARIRSPSRHLCRPDEARARARDPAPIHATPRSSTIHSPAVQSMRRLAHAPRPPARMPAQRCSTAVQPIGKA